MLICHEEVNDDVGVAGHIESGSIIGLDEF